MNLRRGGASSAKVAFELATGKTCAAHKIPAHPGQKQKITTLGLSKEEACPRPANGLVMPFLAQLCSLYMSKDASKDILQQLAGYVEGQELVCKEAVYGVLRRQPISANWQQEHYPGVFNCQFKQATNFSFKEGLRQIKCLMPEPSGQENSVYYSERFKAT